MWVQSEESESIEAILPEVAYCKETRLLTTQAQVCWKHFVRHLKSTGQDSVFPSEQEDKLTSAEYMLLIHWVF